MRKLQFLLFVLITFSALTSIFAQDEEIIKVDSSVVRLNVGVVSPRGVPITSLSQNDFAVYEDGVKQSISRFEPTVAPFSVVIILDMSGSTLEIGRAHV